MTIIQTQESEKRILSLARIQPRTAIALYLLAQYITPDNIGGYKANIKWVLRPVPTEEHFRERGAVPIAEKPCGFSNALEKGVPLGGCGAIFYLGLNFMTEEG
jgi:hypothetical protein